MLLYAYGSYGSSTDPSFSSNNLSLLDRGFVYAIAHIRGGQEMGRAWYDQGKLLNKKNTFTDFIAAAEHLIQQGYTSKEKLAIRGGSAGGLLMGAVVNMRPDLFKAVVADVPFVDVINTMMDASIPLTTGEWIQWGDPHKAEYYGYMKSYSPYDNVARKAYPNMLVTAGLNDPQVGYWEPAKWVAKLRANKTDNNILLLRTNMGAGHGGASGRYDALKEQAIRYAFILSALGMAGPK
jgi:Protease II